MPLPLFFICHFVITVSAVLSGVLLAEYCKPIVTTKAQKKVEKIYRQLEKGVGVGTKVEFGSPSANFKKRKFLEAVAPSEDGDTI